MPIFMILAWLVWPVAMVHRNKQIIKQVTEWFQQSTLFEREIQLVHFLIYINWHLSEKLNHFNISYKNFKLFLNNAFKISRKKCFFSFFLPIFEREVKLVQPWIYCHWLSRPKKHTYSNLNQRNLWICRIDM